MQKRPSGSRTAEQYVPLAYFAVVLLLLLAVLPSILRLQPPVQNNSESLSPNAPNNHQNSIIAALSAASSGTAGSGNGLGSNGIGGAGNGGIPPAPRYVPRSCDFGIGNPPRQTFSVYAAPCAPAWQGNNGGATYRGVTANEIRIAVGDPDSGWGNDGPVPVAESSNENSGQRTLTVLQQWFNSRYQFYVVNGSETTSNEVAAADEANDEWHVFAADESREPTMTELARLGIIDFADVTDQLPKDYYSAHQPWLYGIGMDATELVQLGAEMVCKQLNGKDATYAGDPVTQRTKRRFGLMVLDDGSYSEVGPMMQHQLAQQCGASLAAIVGFHSSSVIGAEDEQAAATAVAKMREAGVTTVISAIDWVTAAAVTAEAASEGWFPEWYYSGAGSIDWATNGEAQNQAEWAHAFGVTSMEIPRPLEDTDCYRAYVSIDPANTPDGGVCGHFLEYTELANGIQEAGPNLTALNFENALYRQGIGPPDPLWSMGGGFAPDHHSSAEGGAIFG